MKSFKIPDQKALREMYNRYAEIRSVTTKDLEAFIEETVRVLPSHPTVKGRSKDFTSYFKKYLRILKNEGDDDQPPLITDLIGVRIICPFLEDLAAVENVIKQTFAVVELDRKGAHYTFKEFGYESIHLLIKIPDRIIKKRGTCGCDVAEIQIRTILQNAWAEVEHELVYKAEFTPFDEPMKRKLAAVNASLSLADIVFQEIRTYQRQLIGEMGKRRDSFFRKIEESTDALLFAEGKTERADQSPQPVHSGSDSIDDLLLNALYAHNKGQFLEAIGFYSRILEMRPEDAICSLIYKHRGMANFARSQYEEAIEDFTQSIRLDPSSYKSAYYRGVVRTVLRRYTGAIEDFTQSLTINPYQSFCLYRRGQAYYHLEDYPAALADCEAALALEPESESTLKFREILLEKLKM
ncbi:MAG: tetratricopeptide repeat protein [Treponema sp.]|jgi:putative GTP pyrophosphokinase|nr:tetratricopeptide repeat protein [Treponema sp.]